VNDGVTSLTVTFIGQPSQTLDISFLLSAPHLKVPFAAALAAWGATGLSDGYREGNVWRLRIGFFRFLDEKLNLDLTLDQIDTDLLTAFIHWIDQLQTNKGKPLAMKFKRSIYGTLRVTFSQIQQLEKYNALAKNVHVPSDPWSIRTAQSTPTPSMARDEWEQLYFACVTETEATIRRIEEGWQHMQSPTDGLVGNDVTPKDYTRLSDCLTELAHCYPGRLPSWIDIRQSNPKLVRAIGQHHGIDKVAEYFHPSRDALIAFLVLLAMRTGFNTTSLTEMEWSDVIHEERFGIDRLVLAPFKARSGTRQEWSFLPEDEPAQILSFLERWSARIRGATVTLPEDYVFRYVATDSYKVSWFKGGQTSLASALRKFEQRHGLDRITVRIIRQSVLDIVREKSGNNPWVVRRAGGHKGIDEQEKSYTSAAARQRNDEEIGHLENLRTRWIDSNGVLDPRGLTAERQDWGATTPGFVCLDPLDSPQPGQHAGRLCTAFGACLTCSMAVVDLASPHALVRLLQLRETIREAQVDLDAAAWLTTWVPRLQKLDELWIPAFRNPLVYEQAALLQLPPLAPIQVLE